MMRRTAVTVAMALMLAWPGLMAGQSITSGELAGTVSDSLGQVLYGADVSVIDRASGVERVATVDRHGAFRFTLLPPGEYEVFAEALGYRPRRIRGVPVRPGTSLDVNLALGWAAPPVSQVDTTFFTAGVYESASSAGSRWLTPFAFDGLPTQDRGVNAAADVVTNGTGGLEMEGLPSAFSGIEIDGLPLAPVQHDGFPSLLGLGFPRSAFRDAQVVNGGSDVEWTRFAGTALSVFPREGTATPVVRGFLDWTGSQLSSSKFFATDAASNSTLRGGVILTGPIIPDTAHFVLGVEAEREQTPLPAAWSSDSLVTLAKDSFATDLSGYTRPRIATTQKVSLFGRLDWQLTDDNTLGISAHYGNAKITNGDLGAGALPSLGSSINGSEFAADAVLASTLSAAASNELRAGIEVNSRTDTASGIAGTWVTTAGAGFGADPGLLGQFQRTAIAAREAMHVRLGRHQVKFGVEVTVPSYQITSTWGQTGSFTFGGIPQLEARQGEFVQAVGVAPTAQFTSPEFGGFLQDTWRAAPGFDFLVGLRYDFEKMPQGDIVLNSAWQKASGLQNTAAPNHMSKFAPRAGISWDVGQRHQWLVSAEGGSFFSDLNPAVTAALLTEDGSVIVRRGLGTLSSWPAVPDSVTAPVVGPRLTLLGPSFQVPRTRHFGAGVTGALGHGYELHVSGAYRHTDFLERRTDLNLAGSSGTDQYGRPIYGTLVQEGGLLAAQPGSNRRFAGFDVVSALDPDGYSDYWGITFDLERSFGAGLKLIASYTYSQTTDNWLSGMGFAGNPGGQLSPFPSGLNGQDWSKGTSDFDVPSRLTLAADLTLQRLRGVHLVAAYRYRSGYPFTPGFRPGVDANGDGAANDPAFVDDTMSGMASLISKWSCLRQSAGQFAARNSCRASGVSSLDLRLEVPTVTIGGYPLDLVVDAVNLLESDVGLVDNALYLVDPAKAPTTVGSVTHVPLVVNPNFGNVLVRDSSGRFLRVGLRVNW